ncbi:ribosome biogenesis GTPase Der, partial [candidate division KSB1 bacterium]|nr:ribosome biogenesis GTPase Der [candidate division KSB1 bacterium]
ARVHENIEYFSNVRTLNAIRRCDVAVLLLDAVDGITDQDKKILSHAVDEGKGIVIGVNKWDLIEKSTQTARQFELDILDSVGDVSYIPILFISALTKQRIYKLLDMVFAVYEERKKQLKTAVLNEFLEYAINKHHPPAYGDKYVKINYVTQVKSEPPFFVFFTNEPRGIKKSYKNYLENLLRQQFGFMGVPVRMQFRKKNK